MKVLMTADTLGGVWTYAVDLSRALSERGVNVMLATMGASLSAQQRAQVRELDHVELRESTFRLEWMQEPWEDVARAGQWLLELEREFHPDVVHLNGYAHGALDWSAPVMVVGHSCVLSWWQAVKHEPAPSTWNRYREEVTNGLQRADVVVAPSRTMLDALRSHYGPLRRARVIYNGRDAELFRARLKEPLVLCAGRIWDEAKNVNGLLSAAQSVSWPVHVAGERSGPDGTGVSVNGACFLGNLDPAALAQWLSRAAIYAAPARYEPFGLCPLEAALSGCALVLGDIPSLREIWADAARFVNPDDSNSLARALDALIESQDLRAEMSRRAKNRADRFSLKQMADGYLSAYRAIIQTAQPVRS